MGTQKWEVQYEKKVDHGRCVRYFDIMLLSGKLGPGYVYVFICFRKVRAGNCKIFILKFMVNLDYLFRSSYMSV